MPDLRAYFRTARVSEFSGTVYRICPARYADKLVSMRGSLLHGARYNIRGYFGALYTSLSHETARREMARYFTAAPRGGFVEASIRLRLGRVVDLTNTRLLRKPGIEWGQLIGTRYAITQEIGLRAWENGIEALMTPSAAYLAERNLALLLDNQRALWEVALTEASMPGDSASRQIDAGCEKIKEVPIR
jgi:RES domain-containing protein